MALRCVSQETISETMIGKDTDTEMFQARSISTAMITVVPNQMRRITSIVRGRRLAVSFKKCRNRPRQGRTATIMLKKEIPRDCGTCSNLAVATNSSECTRTAEERAIAAEIKTGTTTAICNATRTEIRIVNVICIAG